MPQYEVQDPQIAKLLSDIGAILKGAMPPGYVFALLIAGKGGLFYASSAEREDVIVAMQDFIKKFREN